MREEMDSLYMNHTWILVDMPKVQKVIDVDGFSKRNYVIFIMLSNKNTRQDWQQKGIHKGEDWIIMKFSHSLSN